MSVSVTRRTTLTYAGDVVGTEIIDATENLNSPGVVEFKTLASGANTITPPTGGSVPKAVTITLPVGNVITVTLKGVTGDAGVLLSPLEPFTITLGTPTTTFVLTVSAELTGVRFFWT